MASQRSDTKSWMNDYLYVNKNGNPVCHEENEGLSRKIQMEHRSKQFCALEDGTYYYCNYPYKPRTIKTSFLTTNFLGKYPEAKSDRQSKISLPNGKSVHEGKRPCCSSCAMNRPCQGNMESSMLPLRAKDTRNRLPQGARSSSKPRTHDSSSHRATVGSETGDSGDFSPCTTGAESVSGRSVEEDGAESVMHECLRKFGKLAEMEDKVRKTIERDERKPDLSDVLDKYGWRAEMYGDPYDLKPIHQRLPYSVPMAYQTVEGPWPQHHYKFNTPFFLNTIPKQRYTFVIHPHFLSEYKEELPPPKKAVYFK